MRMMLPNFSKQSPKFRHIDKDACTESRQTSLVSLALIKGLKHSHRNVASFSNSKERKCMRNMRSFLQSEQSRCLLQYRS